MPLSPSGSGHADDLGGAESIEAADACDADNPWNLTRPTAEGWRWRTEASEFGTVSDLAIAVNLAERHVSRQLRLAHLATEVLKRLTYGREASAVSLYDLCFLAGETWQEQVGRAVGERPIATTRR